MQAAGSATTQPSIQCASYITPPEPVQPDFIKSVMINDDPCNCRQNRTHLFRINEHPELD